MGRGPRYRVAFRRRRMNLTDYKMRKTMICSKIPRLIVRFSLKYIYVQLAEAYLKGDKILASACSKELDKFGWRATYRNTPAAYLIGLLLGKRALAIGVENAILDIGLKKPSVGSRVFAVLKGVIDAGLKVPCNERVFPSEERIKGEHIASYAKMLEEDQQRYEKTFSRYLSQDSNPKQLPDFFLHVKNNLLNIIESSG